MTEFWIRPAGPHDADDIARVHVYTWQVSYAGIVPRDVLDALDPAAWAVRRRQRMAEPEFTTMVAERGDDLLGFVTYGPYREEDRLDHSVGEIVAIYVHPGHQRAGVGLALIDLARDELTKRGVSQVRLWVFEENVASRRFYERSGLAPDGQRHLFRIVRPDGTAVLLPEVRYAMPVETMPVEPRR